MTHTCQTLAKQSLRSSIWGSDFPEKITYTHVKCHFTGNKFTNQTVLILTLLYSHLITVCLRAPPPCTKLTSNSHDYGHHLRSDLAKGRGKGHLLSCPHCFMFYIWSLLLCHKPFSFSKSVYLTVKTTVYAHTKWSNLAANFATRGNVLDPLSLE